MQSFSSAAKAEICRIFPQERCCALAECFGILLFCHTFRYDSIRIVTESTEFAAMLPKLFRKAFSVQFDEVSGEGTGQKNVFVIHNSSAIANVMKAFGFEQDATLAMHINLPVVEKECCRNAFFRGAFLAGGSVTDPAKGYHLEFATTHQGVSRQCCSLMQEVLDTVPMRNARGACQVVYLKQSEKIADLLAYLGAGVASMGILEARLEKELNNRVNRRCNCDDANISKIIEASAEQMKAIRTLRESGRFDSLPDKLKQAAMVREQNPDSSLSELAMLMVPVISKPAMSHRLKRLAELAGEYEK